MDNKLYALMKSAVLTVLLLVPLFAHADKKAWVEYQADTQTLTFHYDENMESVTATAKTDLDSMSSFDKSIPKWLYDDNTYNPRALEIVKVVFDSSFADARPTSCANWFNGLSRLATIEGLEYLNTSKVTDMSDMFYCCRSLTSLDLSHFDIGNVTNMKAMFELCSNLVEINLTSFDIRKKKVASAVDYMFRYCSKLRNIMVYDDHFYIEEWNTMALTLPCSEMFEGAVSLPGYDGRYTSGRMCRDLARGGYLNNVNVTPTKWVEYQESTATLTFHYDRFEGYTDATGKYDFNEIDTVPAWRGKEITNVVFDKGMKKVFPVTCYHWFYGMDKLKSIKGLNFLNTNNVTNMAGMFSGCSKLDSLDLTSFNTSKVTDMSGMFYLCVSLKSIVAADTFAVAAHTETTMMFESCVSLPNYNDQKVDGSMVKDITLGGYIDYNSVANSAWAEYQADQRTLTFHHNKLRSYSTATETFTVDPSDEYNFTQWATKDIKKVVFSKGFSNVHMQNCNFWFINQSSLQEIEGIENLNTSELTSMESMFSYCTALTSLDFTQLDLSGLKNTRRMFRGSTNLKNIYVSEGFSLPNVTEGLDMFKECYALPNFNSGNVSNDKANYVDGYLTLRRQFTVGDTQYNADGYGDNTTCYDDIRLDKDNVMSSGFAFKLGEGNTISYHRDMNDSWEALCLPFAFDASATNCKFYEISNVGTDAVTVKEITGEVPAGRPVLVYSEQGSFNISGKADSVIVPRPIEDTNMTGTFEEVEVLLPTQYAISGNKFLNVFFSYQPSRSTIISPYSAYLVIDLASLTTLPESLDIVIDGTSGIIDINAADALQSLDGAELYDIQGRRLTTIQPGIVIAKKNGITRKMIVK